MILQKTKQGKRIAIRSANQRDMESVHLIFNEILVHTTATFEEHPYSLQTWLDVLQEKQDKSFPFLVAVNESNQVVGYGTYGPFRRASGYRVSVEHSVHVKSEYRNRGIGSMILESLIQEAKGRGVWSIVAGVDGDNDGSIRLHEKFGFNKVGEMRNIATKFNKSLSLVFLQKDLKRESEEPAREPIGRA